MESVLRGWALAFLPDHPHWADFRRAEFHREVCTRLAGRSAHVCVERHLSTLLPAVHPGVARAHVGGECPENQTFPESHVIDRQPGRFERIDARSLLWLVRHDIIRLSERGVAWFLLSGRLSLHTAVSLLEKLTVDPPVKPTADDLAPHNELREHLAVWATRTFWPRWRRWCSRGTIRRRIDFYLHQEYETVFAALNSLKKKGRGRTPLRTMLLKKADSILAECPPRGLVALPHLELPPRWFERDWKTPEQVAIGVLAHRHGRNTRLIKESLAETRREYRLTYIWQEYRRWLGATPDAVRQLERLLGLSIAS